MKIKDIVPSWYEDKKHYVKRSTMSAYMLLIENHLTPYFGEFESVAEDDVQKFIFCKLDQGLGQKTIKDILIVLKMVVKYGAKKGYTTYIPWEIKYPTLREKNEVQVLTKSQHAKIINHIKDNLTFRSLGVMICLSSGLRIGEVCALTWGDLNTESGTIKVSKTIQRIYVVAEGKRRTELILDTPKTSNSFREIPMTKDLLRIIKPIKKIVNSDFFVLTNESKPTEPRTYRSYYKDFMNRLDMPDLKFHGLRHSFATRCIEKNADVKTVSVLLGHSNISTTLNLYVHPNAEQKKSVINKVFG